MLGVRLPASLCPYALRCPMCNAAATARTDFLEYSCGVAYVIAGGSTRAGWLRNVVYHAIQNRLLRHAEVS